MHTAIQFYANIEFFILLFIFFCTFVHYVQTTAAAIVPKTMAVENTINCRGTANGLADENKVLVQLPFPARLKMYWARSLSSSDLRLRLLEYWQFLVRYLPSPLAKSWQLCEHSL